jgi:hypothetical protein
MSDAPPFDPTKPFTRATPQAPAFDPSKPFTKAPAQPGSKPEARSAISSALSGKDLPGEPAAGGESLSVIDRLWRGLQGKDTSVPGKVAMGMGDPAYGAAQLGARGLRAVGGPDLGVDKAVQERESRYESGRQAELKPGEKLAADWNRLLGNVASPVNLAIGGGLGAAAKGVGLAGRLGAAALGGAAGGATAPVTDPKADYWTEKAKQTGIGAAGGLAMGGAGEAVGAAIAPRMGADAAKLASQGVQMTPGQMARGPAGVAKGMEDRLSGFPVLGDFIRNARRRSVGSFNEATINQALEPIGAKLPAGVKPGNEAVKAAGDAISQAYNKTLGQIPTVVVDRDLQNALKAVQLDAQQRPAVWKNLKGELSRVQNSLKRGNFTGREAQLGGVRRRLYANGPVDGGEIWFWRGSAARVLAGGCAVSGLGANRTTGSALGDTGLGNGRAIARRASSIGDRLWSGYVAARSSLYQNRRASGSGLDVAGTGTAGGRGRRGQVGRYCRPRSRNRGSSQEAPPLGRRTLVAGGMNGAQGVPRDATDPWVVFARPAAIAVGKPVQASPDIAHPAPRETDQNGDHE